MQADWRGDGIARGLVSPRVIGATDVRGDRALGIVGRLGSAPASRPVRASVWFGRRCGARPRRVSRRSPAGPSVVARRRRRRGRGDRPPGRGARSLPGPASRRSRGQRCGGSPSTSVCTNAPRAYDQPGSGLIEQGRPGHTPSAVVCAAGTPESKASIKTSRWFGSQRSSWPRYATTAPRARRKPSLLGPAWWPVRLGRLIQCTRGSPVAVTTRSESSVHPSPTTRSSKSRSVWSSTLAIEYASTLGVVVGGDDDGDARCGQIVGSAVHHRNGTISAARGESYGRSSASGLS